MDYSGHAPTLEHRAPDYAEKIAFKTAGGDMAGGLYVNLSGDDLLAYGAECARQGYMLGAGLSQ